MLQRMHAAAERFGRLPIVSKTLMLFLALSVIVGIGGCDIGLVSAVVTSPVSKTPRSKSRMLPQLRKIRRTRLTLPNLLEKSQPRASPIGVRTYGHQRGAGETPNVPLF